MPRRSHQTAQKGQVYASEWPEWHVDCAGHDCEEHTLIAGLGEAFTVAEAEKAARENSEGESDGWKKLKGLWYCPRHVSR